MSYNNLAPNIPFPDVSASVSEQSQLLTIKAEFPPGQWQGLEPLLWLERFKGSKKRWTHPPHLNGAAYQGKSFWAGTQLVLGTALPSWPTEFPISPDSSQIVVTLDPNLVVGLSGALPGNSFANGTDKTISRKFRFRLSVFDLQSPGYRRFGPASQHFKLVLTKRNASQNLSVLPLQWAIYRDRS